MNYYLLIAVFFYALFSGPETIGQEEPPTSNPETVKNIDSLTSHIQKVFYQGNYAEVIDKTPGILTIADKLENSDKKYILRSVLGNTFIKLKDTIQAREIFNGMLKKAEISKKSRHMMAAYIDLGNTYVYSDPDLAVQYFSDVIDLAKEHNDAGRLFIAYYNLSELYLNQNKLVPGKKNLDNAFIVSENLKIHIYSSSCYMLLGRYHLLSNNPEQAILNFKKSTEMAELINFKDLLLENYKYYLEALELQKDYEGIYEIRKIYEPIREEIYEADKISELEVAKAKYKIDEYKQAIKAKELEKQLAEQKAKDSRTISYFAGGLIFLLLLASVYFFSSLKRRKKLLIDLRRKNNQYLLAKEKSDELMKSKAKFFSTISHELRTPLYGIVGLSSSIMDENKETNLDEDIQSLKFSADYLLALVNDVLNINKLEEQEGKKLESKQFSVSELIKNIVTSFEMMRSQNGNTINIHIAPEVPQKLLGDATKLSQVLMNLIGNACKFTEDGIINIKVNALENDKENIKLKFEIVDTGIGIPKEKQQQIFDEFTQVSAGNKYEGTGLGLSIVNKILDLHDSKLRFKSTLGKGSYFWFEIDYKISLKELSGESETLVNNLEILKGKHILVVDDNRINQIVSQKIIGNNGMTSDTASDGLEAIALVKKTSYDIILMDINMPRMNGFEAAKEIRDMGIDIPIIALTAVNKEENRKKMNAHGIDDIIVKPYEVEYFRKVLSKNLIKKEHNTTTTQN